MWACWPKHVYIRLCQYIHLYTSIYKYIPLGLGTSSCPHRTISRTLCRMLWAFSKFHLAFSPVLSGRYRWRMSSRSTAFCQASGAIREGRISEYGTGDPVHALNQHFHHLVDEFNLVYTSIYPDQYSTTKYKPVHAITSGAIRSRTMNGRVSISIFILSPVILAFPLPSIINVNVVEVGCICSGQGVHGGVSHHCCHAISQPVPHCLESCCAHQRLAFAVHKVKPPQDLSVAMKHGWHNVITEQAQIPARNKYKSVYTRI